MIARLAWLLAILVIVLLGLAFHVRNHAVVMLDFYTGSLELPLSWALVAALAVGVVLGFLAAAPALVRSRRAARRLARQHEALRQELAAKPGLPPPDGR